jgi:hypothetical protein
MADAKMVKHMLYIRDSHATDALRESKFPIAAFGTWRTIRQR